MMVGREVILTVEKEAARPKAVVLELEAISASDDLGQPALRNVSLQVHAGEIVGVAGVQGNGQTELVEVITGLRHTDSGRSRINGQEMTNTSRATLPLRARAATCQKIATPMAWSTATRGAHNLVLNTYYPAALRPHSHHQRSGHQRARRAPGGKV
jgi:ABC-type uncharacterized transport system ATPase subunit